MLYLANYRNNERQNHVILHPQIKQTTNIMELPKDPMILFSFINMKLRDYYPSLDALCADMNVSKEDILNRLKEAGFEYNPSQNKFW